ncbi:MAG: LPS export ABC transporter permease LptG, partial [Gammaproteobacteria bacterium]
MNKVSVYLSKAVIGGFFLSLAALTAVFSLFATIAELDDLGKAGYRLPELIQYLLLTTPRRAFELLPSAALVGALVGLGGLASSGELVALRAAGFSILSIGRVLLIAALPILMFALILGEIAVPPLERIGQEVRSRALNDSFFRGDRSGVWARDDDTFIHVKLVGADRTLQKVTIYEFDQHKRMQAVTTAKQAVNEDNRWILHGIKQTLLDPTGSRRVKAARASWESALAPENMAVGIVEPGRMSIWELHNHAQFLAENGQDSNQYRLAFWQKIVRPLTIAVMVLISLPFVFGSLRSGNLGQRVFVGIVFG